MTLSKNCHFLLGEGAEERDPCSPTPRPSPELARQDRSVPGSLLGGQAGRCTCEVRGGPQLWAPGPRGGPEGFLHVSRAERCFCVFIFLGSEFSLLTGIFDRYFLITRVWRLMSVNPARGHTCEYRGMRTGGHRPNMHVPVCGCADVGPCACSCMRVCTCIRAYAFV